MTESEVLSHIPYEHATHNITEFHYSVTPQNRANSFSLHLVVEGIYEYDTKNKERIVPTHFYFVTNESLDNYFIQKEFNVFLSMFI